MYTYNSDNIYSFDTDILNEAVEEEEREFLEASERGETQFFIGEDSSGEKMEFEIYNPQRPGGCPRRCRRRRWGSGGSTSGSGNWSESYPAYGNCHPCGEGPGSGSGPLVSWPTIGFREFV